MFYNIWYGNEHIGKFTATQLEDYLNYYRGSGFRFTILTAAE